MAITTPTTTDVQAIEALLGTYERALATVEWVALCLVTRRQFM